MNFSEDWIGGSQNKIVHLLRKSFFSSHVKHRAL